jgi:hypothetical protein
MTKAPGINQLRVNCPFCGITMRPHRLRSHASKQHPGAKQHILDDAEAFVAKATSANPGERLAIDLQTLAITFLDRVHRPTLPRSYFQQQRQPAVSAAPPPALIKRGCTDVGISGLKQAGVLQATQSGSIASNPETGLLKQLFCPFCRGTNRLESSDGCFYCG